MGPTTSREDEWRISWANDSASEIPIRKILDNLVRDFRSHRALPYYGWVVGNPGITSV
jgi:hypothetical protein